MWMLGLKMFPHLIVVGFDQKHSHRLHTFRLFHTPSYWCVHAKEAALLAWSAWQTRLVAGLLEEQESVTGFFRQPSSLPFTRRNYLDTLASCLAPQAAGDLLLAGSPSVFPQFSGAAGVLHENVFTFLSWPAKLFHWCDFFFFILCFLVCWICFPARTQRPWNPISQFHAGWLTLVNPSFPPPLDSSDCSSSFAAPPTLCSSCSPLLSTSLGRFPLIIVQEGGNHLLNQSLAAFQPFRVVLKSRRWS